MLFVNILIAQTITNITEITPIACSGGQATYLVSTDATSNFNYQVQNLLASGAWVNTFPVQTNTSPPNFNLILSATTYRVILIDISTGADVFTSNAFTVGQPLGINIWMPATVNLVSCNGGNDGSIELFMAGGTPPYSYTWVSGQNTALITGLTAGSYSCTVTDAAGCSHANNPIITTITQPATLSLSIQQTNI